jgi:hypothetical protein
VVAVEGEKIGKGERLVDSESEDTCKNIRLNEQPKRSEERCSYRGKSRCGCASVASRTTEEIEGANEAIQEMIESMSPSARATSALVVNITVSGWRPIGPRRVKLLCLCEV